MECPHCGARLKAKDFCSSCGKKIAAAPEIEVEYKDFKVSEYLEIRQKEHKDPSAASEGPQKPEGQRMRRYSRRSRRRRPFLAAVVISLIAVAAGAIALFLWKLLGK